MLISIQSGGTVTRLGTKPVLMFGTSTSDDGTVSTDMTVDLLPAQATIATSIDVKPAADRQAIKTINGVAPNSYGEFYIEGSECDNWDYTEDGISLVDLCPSCTTCENIYRLKYEVENLKLWLNTLKDVNMYISWNDDNDEIVKRADLLSQFRITGPDKNPECNESLTFDDGYMHVRGLQLLQQYITTVHMWNYIVSRNNSSTIISTAPEDATGFVVQTKRALTSCNDDQTICCEIEVEPAGVFYDSTPYPSPMPDNYPISVYTPDASNTISFEPLLKDNQGVALGSITKSTVTTLEPTWSEDDPERVNHKAAHKHTTTGVIPVKVAGTYVVGMKFLPFIYYEALREGKPVNIRGGIAQEVTPEVTVEGNTVYPFSISSCNTYWQPSEQKPGEPKEGDYLTAKTVPTCSVTWQIVWDVTVKWTTTDSRGPRVEEENYRYTTNGIRRYFDAIVSGTTVTPPEPEPEPEETTDA